MVKLKLEAPSIATLIQKLEQELAELKQTQALTTPSAPTTPTAESQAPTKNENEQPAKPKRKRRTKAEIEAEKKAEKFAKAAEKAEVPAEPEPEPEPSNVVPMAGEVDEEAVKSRFKNLVARDYDAAFGVLTSIECESFPEVVEQGKLKQLDSALADAEGAYA